MNFPLITYAFDAYPYMEQPHNMCICSRFNCDCTRINFRFYQFKRTITSFMLILFILCVGEHPSIQLILFILECRTELTVVYAWLNSE